MKSKNNQIAIISVIYRKGIPYLRDYLSSLKSQDYKKFDLILFNSDINQKSIDRLKVSIEYAGIINYKLINLGDHAIAALWSKIIKYLMVWDYKKYVFSDIDDYFTPNRVRLLNAWLDKYPLVFHDLNLFFNNTEKIKSNYFGGQVPGKINWRFILDKNCIGFGNSAIRKDQLFLLNIPKELKVIDWYFFMNIMRQNKIQAVFIPQGLTFYRQYGDNIADLIRLNESRIKYALKVKYLQYKYLYKKYVTAVFRNRMTGTMRLIKSRNKIIYLKNIEKKYYGKRNLWWEYAEIK